MLARKSRWYHPRFAVHESDFRKLRFHVNPVEARALARELATLVFENIIVSGVALRSLDVARHEDPVLFAPLYDL